MTKEPHVNLDCLVANIVLDCSLLRRFAFNRCCDEVLAAIGFNEPGPQTPRVLHFLVRHCGGQQ